MNVVTYFCHVQWNIRMCIPSKYMLSCFYWSRIFTEVSVCFSQEAALSGMGCVDREILFLMKIWKLNFTLGCFYLCIPCVLLKYFLEFVLFLLVGALECSPWIIPRRCHKGVSSTENSLSSLLEWSSDAACGSSRSMPDLVWEWAWEIFCRNLSVIKSRSIYELWIKAFGCIHLNVS